MESLGAFDAKARLLELLESAARCKTFSITKHGCHQARARVGRPGAHRQSCRRLENFRRFRSGSNLETLHSNRHQGRRF